MNTKPKLIYLITRTEKGGAQSHVRVLLDYMHDFYNIILVSGEDDWLAHIARQKKLKVIIVPSLSNSINLFENIYCVFKLRKIFKEIQADILHIHSSKAGLLGRMANFKLTSKTIFTAHGWAFGANKPKLRGCIAYLFEKFSSLLCNKIIAVSKYDYNLALSYRLTKQDKLIMIHNGVINKTKHLKRNSNNIANNHQRLFNIENPLRIVSVARLAAPKDHAVLMHAVKILAEQDYAIDCKIIGEGPLRKELQATKDKHHLSNCQLLGSLDSNDIDNHLSNSDLFVLVSNWEGLPISILEAMSASLPIIASEVGGVNEQVQNHLNGFLLESNNAELLAKKIQHFIDKPDDIDKMGGKSYAIFVDNFEASKMLNKTHELYTKLLYNN